MLTSVCLCEMTFFFLQLYACEMALLLHRYAHEMAFQALKMAKAMSKGSSKLHHMKS